MSLILGDSLLRNDKSLETTLNNKIDKLDTSDQSLSSSLLIPNGKSITSYDSNSNLSKLIWINQNKLELGTNNIDTNIYSLNRPKIYTNNNSSIIENEVAYKSEIDNLPNQLKSTFLPLSGGVMTGTIQCNSDMKLSSNNGVIRFGNETDVGHIMVAANNNTFKFLRPGTNSDMDLGNSSNKWKDLYLSGTVNADDVSVNTINANTINQNNKQVANQEDLSNEITNRQTAITNVQNQINTITNAIIRRDVAQTLTTSEKQQAQTNITHTATQNHATSGVQVGWYQVANLKTQGNYDIKIKQAYNYNLPEAIQLAISINHRFFTNEPFASITQISGVKPAEFSLSKIRVRQGTDEGTTFLDVYNPDRLWNTTWVDITSDSQDVVVEPNSPFQFIGTEDNPSGYKISSLDLVTGLNVNSDVTINGNLTSLSTEATPVNYIAVSKQYTIKGPSATQDINVNSKISPSIIDLSVEGTLTNASGTTITANAVRIDPSSMRISGKPFSFSIKSSADDSYSPAASISTNGVFNFYETPTVNSAPVFVATTPSWVGGTSGSLTLPGAGWYILYGNYSYTGIVWWSPQDPNGEQVTTGYIALNNNIAISTSGVVSLLNASSGVTVYYYKIG